jgi:predicted nucleic acid-binding protein
VLIRDVPEDDVKRIRSAAADQGTSMQNYRLEVPSGLKASAHRPGHPLSPESIAASLAYAEALDVHIEATPWSDVHRAWEPSGSLRYSHGTYVAAAERHKTTLLNTDARMERSGAPIRCHIRSVTVTGGAG